MDLIHNLLLGLGVAFTSQNLTYALTGSALGTLIGVLPGVKPVTTMALLLPVIHLLGATPALIMLASIYCGAQYGRSTRAILITLPGESGSAAESFEGSAMAGMGRAGPALAAAALGSFFAGCVGTLIVAALAPWLTEAALNVGAAEYFSLMVFSLTGAAVLASGSLVKAIAMILLGLLLGQVNTDAISGVPRFSFGVPELAHGIRFVAIAIGMFGFGEIIAHLGKATHECQAWTKNTKSLLPRLHDVKDAWPAVFRGSALGSVLGMLPGGGARLASFAAYAFEKKYPAKAGEVPFGQGNIRGVAGPQSARSAGAQISFIPLLTLGIPTHAVMALMAGAMMIKGIQPGPQAMTSNPQIFWGLIASMWAGHLMLIVLNLPLIGIWVRLVKVPYRVIFPGVILLSCVGLYTLNRSGFELYVGGLFGLLGYVFYKLGCQPALLLLGFILGPMMEEYLRRALLLSRGEWSTFVTHPVSGALLAGAALIVVVVLLPSIWGRRQVVFQGR